jgi:hypothetical protein
VSEVLQQAISGEPLRVRALNKIREFPRPYILVRTREQSFFFTVASLPSQFVRRVICDYLGEEDWDWAVNPREQTIRETIELWANLRQI